MKVRTRRALTASRGGAGPEKAMPANRSRRAASATAAALACLLWLGLAAPAQAAPGDLDSTFSDDGKQTTDFGDGEFGTGVVIQSDPHDKTKTKIVVAGTTRGDFALARYNADGTLDTSFSGDGKQTTDFGGGELGTGVAIHAVTDCNIKIVFVSDTSGDFALIRYNAVDKHDYLYRVDI